MQFFLFLIFLQDLHKKKKNQAITKLKHRLFLKLERS